MRARGLRLFAALFLLGLSLFWTVRSVRASAGTAIYFRAKYGPVKPGLEQLLESAERSHAWYPWQYRLCVLAGEAAYAQGRDSGGREIPARFNAARLWCDRGLALNPHMAALRMLDVRLLERQSPLQAARRWDEYVEWQYWEPFNHALRAELYAKAGDFDEATRALEWVRGTEYEDSARRTVMDIRKSAETPLQPH